MDDAEKIADWNLMKWFETGFTTLVEYLAKWAEFADKYPEEEVA